MNWVGRLDESVLPPCGLLPLWGEAGFQTEPAGSLVKEGPACLELRGLGPGPEVPLSQKARCPGNTI